MNYFDVYLVDTRNNSRNEEKEILFSSVENEGILSPELEKEINTAGKFSFTILPSHPKWQVFTFSNFKKLFIHVYIYGQHVFFGRVSSVSMDFYKQTKVDCEGALTFLSDTFTYKNFTQMNDLRNAVIQGVMRAGNSQSPILFNDPNKYISCTSGVYELSGSENLVDNKALIKGYLNSNGAFVSYDDQDCEYPDSRIYMEMIEVDTGSKYLLYDSRSIWTGGKYQLAYFDAGGEFLRVSDIVEKPGIINNGSSDVLKYYTDGCAIFTPRPNDSSDVYYVMPMCLEYSGFGAIGSDIWFQKDTDAIAMDAITDDGYGSGTEIIQQMILDKTDNIIRVSFHPSSGVPCIDILNPKRLNAVCEIEFGMNMIDMNTEIETVEPYSAIYPTADGKPVMVWETGDFGPKEYYLIADAYNKYGFIGKTFEIGKLTKKTDADKQTEAYERCKKVAELYDPTMPISYSVHALDQNMFLEWETKPIIDVGDAVRLYSEPNGVDIVALCLSMKLDLYEPSNNEYKIGKYISSAEDYKLESLTKSFVKTKKKKK